MSDSQKPRPNTGPQAQQAAAERAAREAAALRENLRRRKAQARLRQEDGSAEDAAKPHEMG